MKLNYIILKSPKVYIISVICHALLINIRVTKGRIGNKWKGGAYFCINVHLPYPLTRTVSLPRMQHDIMLLATPRGQVVLSRVK